MATARIIRGRRISRTITCATSLPPPNSASATAIGDSRTAPMPSESSASSTTSADIASVTPRRRRAAVSVAMAKLSTLIHRPVAGMTHSAKSYSQ